MVPVQVSFTGSTATGHRIMEAAATSNLKQVCLELGGKSPFIVFDDVDVHKIAPLALNACLFNQARYLFSHFSFSFLFIQMCFPIIQF